MPRRGRRPDPRGHAVLARGLHPARLGPLLHRVLRLHARGDLHRGRALASSRSCAPPGCRWSRCPGPSVFPLELSAARARRVRPGDAARRLPRPRQRRAAARPGVDGAAVRRRRPRRRPPHRARGPFVGPVGVRGRRALARARRQRLDRGAPPAARRRVDVEVRCRYEDWVDIVAGRLDRAARWPRPAAPARLAARAVGGAQPLLRQRVALPFRVGRCGCPRRSGRCVRRFG